MAGMEGNTGPLRWLDKPTTHPRPMQDLSPSALVGLIDRADEGTGTPEDGLQAHLEIAARMIDLPRRGEQSGVDWGKVKPGERPFQGMSPEDLSDLVLRSRDEGGDVRDYLGATTEWKIRDLEAEQQPPKRDAQWVAPGRVALPDLPPDPAQRVPEFPDRRAFGPPPEGGGPEGAEIGQRTGQPGV
jgi:hypothetical protein